MKQILLVLTAMICCIPLLCQTTKPRKADECNKAVTFCWYGPYADGSDEVDASGNRWRSDDSSEKPLEMNSAIRCVKRLHVCLKAESHDVGGRTMTKIDILPVTRWDSEQITADGEGNSVDFCE